MKEFACEKCGKRFDNEEALSQHKQAKHPVETKKRDYKKYAKIGAGAVAIVLIIAVAAFLMTGSAKYIPKDYVLHTIGPENATVEIVEFSDFQCPYCKAVAPTVKQVIDAYDGKVKLVYKHFPLSSHENSQKAAEASECIADIGGNEKFWIYHDRLFANQNKLFAANLKQYARDIGINATAFDSCLDSNVMSSRVQDDLNEGRRLGVTGTPSFFINGEKISGNQPFSKFKDIIDRKLG